MFVFDKHKNLIGSTVAVAPSPALSGTTLTVATGDGVNFPTPPFNCLLSPASSAPNTLNSEIVRVTNINGDIFTIQRAQEGLTAKSILVGHSVNLVITDKVLSDVEDAVNEVSDDLDTLSTTISGLASKDNPIFTTAITTPKVKVGDGTVGAPAVTFTNDTTMGIYRASNQMQFSANGVSQCQISSSGLTATNIIANTGWFPTSLIVGGLTMTMYITNDGNVRFRDQAVQLYDPAYANISSTAPWCGLTVNNGILHLSNPISNGTSVNGTVSSTAFITADRKIRIKDGYLQLWDDGYAAANINNPWCALMCNNGVISTSVALNDDPMPDGTITTSILLMSDGKVRIKDGLLQFWDNTYFAGDPTKPWCALTSYNGVLSLSVALAT